jgi:hypothetical protein
MTNSAEQDRILSRIRKMMRLANDAGATEGERDNAMRMIHATLAKYNLEMSQVEDSDPAQQEKRERMAAAFLGKPWACQIAMSVAHLYFCKYFSSRAPGNGGPAQKANHHFVGRHSNVITAQEMAQWVVETVNKEAQRFQRTMGVGYGEYRAFAQAAALRIYERCKQIRAESEKQSENACTGLIVANLYRTEMIANDAFLNDAGVKLRQSRSQSEAPGARARAAGAAFGNNVSLNRQVGTSGSNLKKLS